MDPLKKKKLIKWGVAGVLVVIIIVVIVLMVLKSGAPSGEGAAGIRGAQVPANSIPTTPLAADVSSPQTAYQAAAARAKQWHADAAAVKVSIGDKSGQEWSFIFVSDSASNKGFQVITEGRSVSSAQEIIYSGLGTALPANIISPDAAITAAHAIPGLGSLSAVSLELLYNASAQQWYWGIKMANGSTVTIKATS